MQMKRSLTETAFRSEDQKHILSSLTVFFICVLYALYHIVLILSIHISRTEKTRASVDIRQFLLLKKPQICYLWLFCFSCSFYVNLSREMYKYIIVNKSVTTTLPLAVCPVDCFFFPCAVYVAWLNIMCVMGWRCQAVLISVWLKWRSQSESLLPSWVDSWLCWLTELNWKHLTCAKYWTTADVN